MKLARAGGNLTLSFGFLLASLSAQAQQTARISQIGIPTFTPPLEMRANLEAFRQGLRELGYVDGQNILFEIRSAEGRSERLPNLAAELVRLKVDIMLPQTTPAIQAAKRATSTIPIVMPFSSDPVGDGFVTSLSHPGRNITDCRLPAVHGQREYVNAGGLMRYGLDFSDTYRRAVPSIDKIRKGAQPADLPVKQATRFELVINPKTAKALGRKIRQSVLVRPDEVIR